MGHQHTLVAAVPQSMFSARRRALVSRPSPFIVRFPWSAGA
jgi:hypothetical protein